MDAFDAYRAANMLRQLFVDEAVAHASRRYSELKGSGDEAGEQAWSEILAAIVELNATEMSMGQVLH